MKKLFNLMLFFALILSVFSCQKTDEQPLTSRQTPTTVVARYQSDAALVDYLADRIEKARAKGHTSIFMDAQGNQVTNPDRQWLETFLSGGDVSERAVSAKTFAYVEAVGTKGQINNNSMTVYRSGTLIPRGILAGTSSPAGQGANTNLLRYVADGWCNDYWGNFSYTGLSSIEIDVFLWTGNNPGWSQRHASVTSTPFSGYILTDFCDDGQG
jgi:hypothetical protein